MEVAGGGTRKSIEERDRGIMISLINYEFISDELLENRPFRLEDFISWKSLKTGKIYRSLLFTLFSNSLPTPPQ
jgi:hypothetical protein